MYSNRTRSMVICVALVFAILVQVIGIENHQHGITFAMLSLAGFYGGTTSGVLYSIKALTSMSDTYIDGVVYALLFGMYMSDSSDMHLLCMTICPIICAYNGHLFGISIANNIDQLSFDPNELDEHNEVLLETIQVACPRVDTKLQNETEEPEEPEEPKPKHTILKNATTNTNDSHSIRLISIEGNIGSGKSELMKMLRRSLVDNLEYQFIDEPVSVWESICDYDGKSMLAKFYEDQTRYAFAFQIMAFATRTQYIQEAIRNATQLITDGKVAQVTLIMERSLGCDEHIFAQLLHDQGQMESVEYQIYQKYAAAIANVSYFPSVIVWVNTAPETCVLNIVNRGRKGESNIDAQYIRDIHTKHVNWLADDDSVVRINDFNLVDLTSETSTLPTRILEWVDNPDLRRVMPVPLL